MTNKVLAFQSVEAADKARTEFDRVVNWLNELNEKHAIKSKEQLLSLMSNPELYFRDHYFDRDDFAKKMYERSGEYVLPDDLSKVLELSKRVKKDVHGMRNNLIPLLVFGEEITLDEKKVEAYLDEKYNTYLTDPLEIRRFNLASSICDLMNENLSVHDYGISKLVNEMHYYDRRQAKFLPSKGFVISDNALIKLKP